MLTLGICTLALLQSGPISVPAQWTGSSWAVDVTVDGTIHGHLVISTGINLSRVSETWLGSHSDRDDHKLMIGDVDAGVPTFTVGNFKISTQNGQVFDGELGMDVLKDYAIGFDWTTRTVMLWPGGHVNDADARAWVAGGAMYPGEIDPPTATSIPITFEDEHHLPELSGMVNGQPASMRIWSRMFTAALRDEQMGADPMDPQGLFSLDLGFPSPWNYTTAASAYGPDGKGAPGASLRSLEARRVILDFPGGVAYRQQLPSREMTSLCLSLGLPIGVHVDGNRLRVGPVNEFSFVDPQRAKDYNNAQIRRIADVKAEDIVKLIKSGSSRDKAMVEDLFKRFAAHPTITFVRDGREVTMTMSVTRD
jgi:hypothetical protein